MKKLILLFIGSIILFSLWKCVFFPSKDSTSSSENFPIPSSSSDTTSKEPNESDAVLKSSNSMRESLSSSSSTSDEPFSTDESNDYKSEELIDTTAQKFQFRKILLISKYILKFLHLMCTSPVRCQVLQVIKL